VDWVVPLAVSPDGEQILTALGSGVGAGTLGTAELALIAAADGTKRTLRTFDGSFPNAASFSPDGR
jgi:sugar lactone lactonase YvrE